MQARRKKAGAQGALGAEVAFRLRSQETCLPSTDQAAHHTTAQAAVTTLRRTTTRYTASMSPTSAAADARHRGPKRVHPASPETCAPPHLFRAWHLFHTARPAPRPPPPPQNICHQSAEPNSARRRAYRTALQTHLPAHSSMSRASPAGRRHRTTIAGASSFVSPLFGTHTAHHYRHATSDTADRGATQGSAPTKQLIRRGGCHDGDANARRHGHPDPATRRHGPASTKCGGRRRRHTAHVTAQARA
ncbi:hypothetical protein C8J57DRAFT_1561808 [Mycena rebaudengoi]|nr:hypothetical protein C8J57DRAFT_1561808 [Mycena rebaudengoi]